MKKLPYERPQLWKLAVVPPVVAVQVASLTLDREKLHVEMWRRQSLYDVAVKEARDSPPLIATQQAALSDLLGMYDRAARWLRGAPKCPGWTPADDARLAEIRKLVDPSNAAPQGG